MAFPHRSLAAIAAALVSLAVHASYHTYQIDELYSNADGTVQYVILHEASGMNGQNLLAGHTLTAMHGAQMKSFAFTRDLPGEMCGYYSCMPGPTAGTRVLIATDGFTALGLVTPDYVVPNGFLPVDGGTVNYAGADTLTFAALPTDGLKRSIATERHTRTSRRTSPGTRRASPWPPSIIRGSGGRPAAPNRDGESTSSIRATGSSAPGTPTTRRARRGGCRCSPPRPTTTSTRGT